ncbi:MAG: DUF1593 domain-containing protein [Treponema sp.]|jgi:hypothetical protein|nr:DUF1593 domain-containing protein [Treponema sp.]
MKRKINFTPVYRTSQVFTLFVLIALSGCEQPTNSPSDPNSAFPLTSAYNENIRTIITTDLEVDDLNSMAHMLLYANEINIIGLIYSDSQYHFTGYPGGLIYGVLPTDNGFNWPITSNTSNDKMSWHIDLAVDAYEDAYQNLVRHDTNYPPPYKLRHSIYDGNISGNPAIPQKSEGSNFIVKVLMDDAPGKVFIQCWGGMTTVARALRTIRETYQSDAVWSSLKQKISNKLVITSFGFQDNGGTAGQTYITEIGQYWPDIQHRQVSSIIWGYSGAEAVFEKDADKMKALWLLNNVTDVGPLGAIYTIAGVRARGSTWGTNDIPYWLYQETDPAKLDEQSEIISGMGYHPVRMRVYGDWVSEGDSSNWALLVDNGLRSWEHPTWGGWGGRQIRRPNITDNGTSVFPVGVTPDMWTNSPADTWTTGAGEYNKDNETSQNTNDSAAARWFGYMMNDFATRLQWSIKPPEECNHEPVIAVSNNITGDETLDFRAAKGTSITLTASLSDPDNNQVHVRWWQYKEADTYTGDAGIPEFNSAITFTVPDNADSGSTIHIIAEATDNGTPSLTSWQRIVVTVQ